MGVKWGAARAEKRAALGAIIGAIRKKDPGESRGKAILRSAGTDLATTLGGDVGAAAGGIAGLLGGSAIANMKGLSPDRSIKGMGMVPGMKFKGGKPSPAQLKQIRQILQRRGLIAGGLGLGVIGGGLAGGAGAFQLAKRKPLTTGEKVKGTLKDLKKKLLG